MQGQSIFDPNAFLETSFKGQQDTNYVLPDIGDYPAQIVDTPRTSGVSVRSGIGSDGRPYATLDVQWQLNDDSLAAKLNMTQVLVRQSFFLDLTDSTPPQLDLGTNKNMRLKRLWDATGINKAKQVSIGMLKFQTAVVHVDHRPDSNDPDIIYAEVTRVTSADKARSNGAG
jgi:hypothetical protein